MRKQIIFFFAILATLSLSLNAQSYVNIYGGPQLSGVSITGISENVLPNRELKVTAMAGVGYERVLTNNLHFQTGLDFARRGFISEISTEEDIFDNRIDIGVTAHTTMDYLSIPLQLKYVSPGEKAKFFVYGGPRASFAMNGRIRTIANFILQFNTGTIDLNPSGNFLEQFAIGADIGTGVSFPLKNQDEFFMAANFYHAFNNVLNDPIVDVRLKSYSIGLNLGYKINLSK